MHDRHVTVEQFCAVGDGVTDDTAAIQAALDCGDVIHFQKDKNYRITDSLFIKNTGSTGFGKRLVGDNAASFGNNLTCRITWDRDPQLHPDAEDIAMLVMYTCETVIEGLAFVPAPGRTVQCAIRVTQGTSPQVMTENHFRHCYFGTWTPGSQMTYGVIIGDNIDYPPNSHSLGDDPPRQTWPNNCDFCKFYECTFKDIAEGCVFVPNQSAQSVGHTFDLCRFGPAKFAFGGPITNCALRQCAFASLSEANIKIGTYAYETTIFGGSSEVCRRLAWNMSPNLAGIVASLKITNHRFFVNPSVCPEGSMLLEVLIGGPVILDGLMFSGQYNKYRYVVAANPSTDDPCPIVAIGCSFPWESPFIADVPGLGRPHNHQRTVIGCNFANPNGSGVPLMMADEFYTNAVTFDTRPTHRFDAVHDEFGNKILGRQVGPIADLTGGPVLADTITKVNEILGALRSHGLLSSFAPTDLGPELFAWYDAAVWTAASWKDLSGHGHDLLQATRMRQFSRNATDAAYRSHPTLNMGTGWMATAAIALPQPFTAWVVGEVANDPGVILGGLSAGQAAIVQNGELAVYFGGAGGISHGGTWIGRGARMGLAIADSYSSAVVADGIDEGVLPQAVDVGTQGLDGLTVGANPAGGQPAGGKIAEIILVSGHQTLRRRQLVGSYLAAKYGITIS